MVILTEIFILTYKLFLYNALLFTTGYSTSLKPIFQQMRCIYCVLPEIEYNVSALLTHVMQYSAKTTQ